MPETIIIISILISISVVFVLNAQQNKNQKQQIIDQFKSYGEVTSKDNHFYFHIHEQTYELLFFKVPYKKELTINSKHMWEIHYKSNSEVINQSAFLSGKHKKIIIVYPSDLQIKRYINENEMTFISYLDEFYDMRVIRTSEIKQLLSEDIL